MIKKVKKESQKQKSRVFLLFLLFDGRIDPDPYKIGNEIMTDPDPGQKTHGSRSGSTTLLDPRCGVGNRQRHFLVQD
jgi:hypothetical protein